MKVEMVLSGVGGQGLISTAEIIGKAASVYSDGLYASMSAAYGSEARGTFTKSDVIISDKQIGYPNVEEPDVVLCLAQVAYDKYATTFTEKTKVFYDTDLVIPLETAKGEHFGYPFRSLSIEAGNIQSANFIALGVIIHRIGILSKESLLEALKSHFNGKKNVILVNTKALEKGLSL